VPLLAAVIALVKLLYVEGLTPETPARASP
jgi:hypothetical protein